MHVIGYYREMVTLLWKTAMLWFYVPLRDKEGSRCREVAATHSDHFQQVSLHIRNVHTYTFMCTYEH